MALSSLLHPRRLVSRMSGAKSHFAGKLVSKLLDSLKTWPGLYARHVRTRPRSSNPPLEGAPLLQRKWESNFSEVYLSILE